MEQYFHEGHVITLKKINFLHDTVVCNAKVSLSGYSHLGIRGASAYKHFVTMERKRSSGFRRIFIVAFDRLF